MSDLESSRGSRTLDSPGNTFDSGRSTELGPPSIPDPESTDPHLRQRELSEEALRYLPLDPPGRPDSIGRLDHYEILGVVGRGAMGVVVRAFDTQLTRMVAIKLMTPQLTSSMQAVSRFNREARAAAGINHPNVVTIHAVSEHKGISFLVMEYVDGTSLMDRIRSDVPLSHLDVLRISVQIASGLAAAHRHGVIHRDIKPANIMLEKGVERVKITDFGLARVLQDQSELTSQGAVVGTPAYMSPEQVNGIPLDSRSDLFSLGCVLYAMIAGHSPFRAENVLGAARRVASMEHVPLGDVNKGVPNYFAKVVDRLLEKEPDHRYRSADEVVEELTAHLAKAHRGVDPTDDSMSRSARLGRKSGIVLIAAALILAVVTLLIALRGRSSEGIAREQGAERLERTDDILTVGRDSKARFTSIGEAIRRAKPGQTIRVVDSAVYDETLPVLGSRSLEGLRLESTASAVLRRPGDRPVLTIDGTPRVVISGFKIEARSGQHAIEIRKSCPGVLVEDCEIIAEEDSPVAAVYLHADARGTPDAPISLNNCRISCGGVGLVLGGLEDVRPVSHVEILSCRIRAPNRGSGIPIVLQVNVSDVSIRRNVIANGDAGISLFFDHPDRATDIRVEDNSLGNSQAPFALNSSDPNQGIVISGNRIVDSGSVLLDRGGIEPFAGWFKANFWEHGPDFDDRLAGLFPRPSPPPEFASRDPLSDEYLGPARPASPASRRGTSASPKVPGGSNAR